MCSIMAACIRSLKLSDDTSRDQCPSECPKSSDTNHTKCTDPHHPVFLNMLSDIFYGAWRASTWEYVVTLLLLLVIRWMWADPDHPLRRRLADALSLGEARCTFRGRQTTWAPAQECGSGSVQRRRD